MSSVFGSARKPGYLRPADSTAAQRVVRAAPVAHPYSERRGWRSLSAGRRRGRSYWHPTLLRTNRSRLSGRVPTEPPTIKESDPPPAPLFHSTSYYHPTHNADLVQAYY